MKLLMIADDFTGSMDTGAQFAACGAEVTVFTSPEGFISAGSRQLAACDVAVVDAELRHSAPDAAYGVTARLLDAAPGCPHVYLKTDSALRGNLSAQFAAVLEHFHSAVPFVPAYPAAGRTTVGGRQYVAGRPLEQSVFAADPLDPMTTSSVAEILNKTHSVPSHSVAAGQTPPRADGVLVFDAQTDADLAAVAERIAHWPGFSLTAGCAGFAPHIARAIGLGGVMRAVDSVSHPMFVICGSANAVTFGQLIAARDSGVDIFMPSADELLRCGGEQISRAANAVREGHSAVICTAMCPEDAAALRMVCPEGSEHERVAAYVALAARALAELPCGAAIIGGDACRAALGAWAVGSVRAAGMQAEGVARSYALIGDVQRLLITKSGGLGDRDAIVRICAEGEA